MKLTMVLYYRSRELLRNADTDHDKLDVYFIKKFQNAVTVTSVPEGSSSALFSPIDSAAVPPEVDALG